MSVAICLRCSLALLMAFSLIASAAMPHLAADVSAGATGSAAPTASISPSSGPIGVGVTVTGSGWIPGRLYSAEWLDGVSHSPLSTAFTDASGNLRLSFDVPPYAVPGNTEILVGPADGAVGDTYAFLHFTVTSGAAPSPTPSPSPAPTPKPTPAPTPPPSTPPTCPSQIVLSPSSGPVGTRVNAAGCGFTAGRNIEVRWDDQNQLLTTVVVGSDGRFTASFTVPATASVKSHTVYFVDPTGNVGSFVPATFTVTSNTPQVTTFTQGDDRWADDDLARDPVSCGTLKHYGCAVTSVAIVFASYGKTKLPDGRNLDPRTLNDWLSKSTPRGFSGCALVWTVAARAVGLGNPLDLRPATASWETRRQAIDSALAAGDLPIVEIASPLSPTGGHFLVLTQKLTTADGSTDYLIIDPFNSQNNNRPLSQVYGTVDSQKDAHLGVRIYKRNSQPQAALSAVGHSPIEFLVTAPDGRKTGFDPASRQRVQAIPESSYGIEPGIAPPDGSAPAQPDSLYFSMSNPTDGMYQVQILGTGLGGFTVDIQVSRADGNSTSQTVTGTAAPGSTQDVSVPVSASPAAAPLPAGSTPYCFQQTGLCARSLFLDYWLAHGGLAINGYPISDEHTEVLEDGKAYTVQYFERVRMEFHPENMPPYNVLLGQFGRRIHPADPPVSPKSGTTHFPATGHNVGARFLAYWDANGGLAQFGLPLSEEFTETLEDGKSYLVQYFERARFEYHPENAPPYDVLLGQFGRRILSGETADQWGPTLIPLTGGQSYVHPKGIYSAVIPTNWVQKDVTDRYATFSSPNGGLLCRIGISAARPGETLADFDESYGQAFQNRAGYVLIKHDRVIVQGQRTFRRVFATNSSIITGTNSPTKSQAVYYLYGQFFILSFCEGPPDGFDANAATFDGIAGSMRLASLPALRAARLLSYKQDTR